MAYRIEPAICILVKVEKDVCQVLKQKVVRIFVKRYRGSMKQLLNPFSS